MASVREWPCWEITRCDGGECCLARQQELHAKPCWEIAGELDDYRSALDVCKDCLVYVVKQGFCRFSEAELEAIVSAKKVECVLAANCPSRGGAGKGV